jgi:hypothetical protein
MFYYGQYKDGLMKNSKGVQTILLNYEAGAIERGMVFIAFSLADLDELCGWRYFICGSELYTLLDECNRFWMNHVGFVPRGRWEINRLDRKNFIMCDTSGLRVREINGDQLTFG